MEHALVIQAARFGDLLQSKRLLLSLQRQYKVHLCIDKSLADLGRIIYPDAIVHGADFHATNGQNGAPDNEELFEQLRGLDPAWIYNLNFSHLTACICRMFKQDRIVSYRPEHHSFGGISRSPWARLVFRMTQCRVHSSINLVDFWAYMDANPIGAEKVNPEAKGGGRGIGVALAGRNARRSLSVEALAAIVRVLFNVNGAPEIRLFGTSAEGRGAQRLKHYFTPAMAAKTIDLCGKTNWADLIKEMSGLDFLLTPDTGLMHLAAHLGVPVVAFFLSSAWCHETGPYGAGHMVWQVATDCAPCLENRACPRNLACHEPFASQDFTRFLALAMAGKELPRLPSGLQLWKSGFDKLGARPVLLAGEDKGADMRMEIRRLASSWLGINSVEADRANLPVSAQSDIVNRLFPANEWMLPGWRYC